MGRITSYKRRKALKAYPLTKSVFIGQDDGCGVGRELYSSPYGKAHDHNVASGGHNKDAVLLLMNVDREVRKGVVRILNVAPSILDLFAIDWQVVDLDGVSILES